MNPTHARARENLAPKPVSRRAHPARTHLLSANSTKSQCNPCADDFIADAENIAGKQILYYTPPRPYSYLTRKLPGQVFTSVTLAYIIH